MADPITEIGLIAGDIWHLLDSKGGSGTLSETVSSLGKPANYTLMGLGWLAREGQISVKEHCNDLMITRRKREN